MQIKRLKSFINEKDYSSLEVWEKQASKLGLEVTKDNKTGTYHAWSGTKHKGSYLTSGSKQGGTLSESLDVLIKKIKCEFQGWTKGNVNPESIKKRAEEYTDEELNAMRDVHEQWACTSPSNKHSPVGFQKRILDREAKKRGITNESFILEGENLSKLVNYAKANPEIGDAVGLVVKKYISKMNPNVASIITSTVKETGVPKQKLLDALTELGFTELTGAA